MVHTHPLQHLSHKPTELLGPALSLQSLRLREAGEMLLRPPIWLMDPVDTEHLLPRNTGVVAAAAVVAKEGIDQGDTGQGDTGQGDTGQEY